MLQTVKFPTPLCFDCRWTTAWQFAVNLQIAITGKSFFKSSAIATELIMNNILRIGKVNVIGDVILSLGKLCVSLSSVLFGFLMLDTHKYKSSHNKISSPLFPVLVCSLCENLFLSFQGHFACMLFSFNKLHSSMTVTLQRLLIASDGWLMWCLAQLQLRDYPGHCKMASDCFEYSLFLYLRHLPFLCTLACMEMMFVAHSFAILDDLNNWLAMLLRNTLRCIMHTPIRHLSGGLGRLRYMARLLQNDFVLTSTLAWGLIDSK